MNDTPEQPAPPVCEKCAGLLAVIDHVSKEREVLREALKEASAGLGIYHRSAKRALGEKV